MPQLTDDLFCDHCGQPLESSKAKWVSSMPLEATSVNHGESAVLCSLCHSVMETLIDKWKRHGDK